MKAKDNFGSSGNDLETGYSSTGYIPEVGDDLTKISEMEKKERQEERMEMKMHKMFGMEEEIPVGFLDRKNRHERM